MMLKKTSIKMNKMGRLLTRIDMSFFVDVSFLDMSTKGRSENKDNSFLFVFLDKCLNLKLNITAFCEKIIGATLG